MIGRKAKLELLLILAVVLVSQVICPLPNDSPEGDSEVGEVQTSGVNRLGKGTNVNNSKLSAKNNFPNVMPLKETATTTLESTTKSAEGASQGTAQKTLDGKKLSQGEQKSKSEEASTDIETTDKSSQQFSRRRHRTEGFSDEETTSEISIVRLGKQDRAQQKRGKKHLLHDSDLRTHRGYGSLDYDNDYEPEESN